MVSVAQKLQRLQKKSGLTLVVPRLIARGMRRVFEGSMRLLWKQNLAQLDEGALIQLKVSIERPRLVYVGKGSKILTGCEFTCHSESGALRIEENVEINQRVHIDHAGGLTIEPDAIISVEAMIFTHSHGFDPHSEPVLTPMRIGRGAWLGARCMVMAGVSSIGEGAVVGAGAIVTKNVPPYTVVAGNPARVIRTLEAEKKVMQEATR